MFSNQDGVILIRMMRMSSGMMVCILLWFRLGIVVYFLFGLFRNIVVIVCR